MRNLAMKLPHSAAEMGAKIDWGNSPSNEKANTYSSIPRQAFAEGIALDPTYHDVLSLLKTARNGAVYGSKVRFPHALV